MFCEAHKTLHPESEPCVRCLQDEVTRLRAAYAEMKADRDAGWDAAASWELQSAGNRADAERLEADLAARDAELHHWRQHTCVEATHPCAGCAARDQRWAELGNRIDMGLDGHRDDPLVHSVYHVVYQWMRSLESAPVTERVCRTCGNQHPEYPLCTNDRLKGNWIRCNDVGHTCGAWTPKEGA